MLLDRPRTELELPPLFQPVPFEAPDRLFAEACARAAEAGAGTLLYGESAETLAVAVVLEPEEPLTRARFAFFVGMSAIADALAVHCLPERDIAFAWPDGILYDGARLGGGRMAWAPECDEASVPDWMVFGIELIRDRPGLVNTGELPDSISLAEEELTDTAPLIESFARHLMRGFDAMAHEGVQAVTKPYLDRLQSVSGGERLIDGRGDLMERESAEKAPVRHPLAEGLAACRWYDPARKGPLL